MNNDEEEKAQDQEKKRFEKRPEGFEGVAEAANKITSVKLSKKDKQLWVIIFEDGQWIRLFDEVAYGAGMKKGAELTTEAIETALLENDRRMAVYSGMNTLLRVSKTEMELKRKLLQKGYRPESVESALEKLKELGYLDDAAYAKLYAEYRIERESASKITMGLLKKGVSKQAIRDALADLGDEGESASLAGAKTAAEKKLARMGDLDIRKRKEKLMMFLMGRGYSYDVVKRVVGEVLTATAE